MTTVGVQKVCLSNIHTRITNSLIIGVIIARSPPKIFSDKKNGNSRAVWNFTLRDSIHDYINVTCWGSEEFIMFLSKSFNVKDVVNIIDARIEIRNIEDIGEKYRPAVTSPFNLIINEKRSTIVIHGGEDYPNYLKLLHIPTKSLAGCLTLADIQNNGATFRGDFVDVLVIVKHVKPPRKINRKDGTETNISDLVVMDRTCSEMNITLWEDEYIERAQTFKPCHTVLFMADMRAEWSKWHNGMIVSITTKTVITEDPDILAAKELRDYAKEAPKNITAYLDKMADKIPNIDSSNCKIMSAQQIIDMAQKDTPSNSNEQYFTALVYAFVNKLDLDGFSRITNTRCGRCNSFVTSMLNNNYSQCPNLECPVGSGAEHPTYHTYFDINVHLMDHTASLINCRLSGKTAEKVLGVKIEQFVAMSSEEKEKLKWKFLLERCLVHVMAFKCMKQYEPFISILSWRIADSEEVFNNLPFY